MTRRKTVATLLSAYFVAALSFAFLLLLPARAQSVATFSDRANVVMSHLPTTASALESGHHIQFQLWAAESLYMKGQDGQAKLLLLNALPQMHETATPDDDAFNLIAAVDVMERWSSHFTPSPDPAPTQDLPSIYQSTLTGFAYWNDASTSNQLLMAAAARYLAYEKYPTATFASGFSASDPTGHNYLVCIMHQFETHNLQEYDSDVYTGAYLVSLRALADYAQDTTIRAEAQMNYDWLLANAVSTWMNSTWAATAYRRYFDIAPQNQMENGSWSLWPLLGGPLPGSGFNIELMQDAIQTIAACKCVSGLIAEDGTAYTPRQEIMDLQAWPSYVSSYEFKARTFTPSRPTYQYMQDSYITPNFALFGETDFETSSGTKIALNPPAQVLSGVVWNPSSTNAAYPSNFYAGAPKWQVDTSNTGVTGCPTGSDDCALSNHTYGFGQYGQYFQSQNAQLAVYNYNYATLDTEPAQFYIYAPLCTSNAYPWNFANGSIPNFPCSSATIPRAVITSETATLGHLYLFYDNVLISLWLSHPFTWDGLHELSVYAPSSLSTNLEVASAIEVASPSQFLGASDAVTLANFQAYVDAHASLNTAGLTGTNPYAIYTSSNGAVMKNVFGGTNYLNGTAQSYTTWPLMQTPWVSQVWDTTVGCTVCRTTTNQNPAGIGGGLNLTITSPVTGNQLLYNFTSNTVTETLGQTINFPTLSSPVTPGSTSTLAATASSGLAVNYSVTGPATLSGSLLTYTGTGTVTITASQAGNSTYNAAQNVVQTVTVVSLQGSVHQGSTAVTGATVSLYLAGINTPTATPPFTGYSAGATLLASTTTDGSGKYTFNSFTCPTPSQQAYLVSSGGNPGLPGSVNNTKAVLMAALGTCTAGATSVAAIANVNIDEVTTVAAVWALQQFIAPPIPGAAPNIGAPNTAYSNGLTGSSAVSVKSALVGMNNAFVTAQIMADINTGTSPNTHYMYATPETAKINTIADILAYCVDSDPSTSANCANMLADATPAGQTTATDTVQAAWYMAQNPINNLSTLYSLISSAPSFTPIDSAPGTTSGSAPSPTAFNDTTLAINYAPSSGGTGVLGSPYGIAIDAYGNAWFSNTGQASVSGATPTGAVPASIAELSPSGNVLLAPTTTFNLSTSGGSASFFTTTQPANTRTITAPSALAIDLANQAWIVNGDTASGVRGTTTETTGDVGVFSASSAAGSAGGVTNTGYLVGLSPFGIAIDGSDNVFVTNVGSTSNSIADRSVSRMAAADGSGFTYSTASVTTPPNGLPGGSALLAIDTNTHVSGGIVWSADYTACKVNLDTTPTDFGLFSQYSASADIGLTNSEIATSLSGATIGAGTTTNCGATNITIGQVLSASFTNPYGIAIDRNNGVWATDQIQIGGFDGLTYLTAPTSSTGAVPSAVTLVNGIAPTPSNGVGTPGTTLAKPVIPEVDGNNNVWVSLNSAKAIVEASVSTTGSSPTITLLTPGQGAAIPGAAYGYGFAHNMYASRWLAIDPSGNIWVTNDSTATFTNQSSGTTAYGSSVTVIVGAAGPVITPLALRIKSNKLGARP